MERFRTAVVGRPCSSFWLRRHAAGVAACSSSPVVLRPMPTVSASASGAPSSRAAIATGCIGASEGDQTAPLSRAAGGVTGTLNGRALSPSTGSGCASLAVEVATGADASLQLVSIKRCERGEFAERAAEAEPAAIADRAGRLVDDDLERVMACGHVHDADERATRKLSRYDCDDRSISAMGRRIRRRRTIRSPLRLTVPPHCTVST